VAEILQTNSFGSIENANFSKRKRKRERGQRPDYRRLLQGELRDEKG